VAMIEEAIERAGAPAQAATPCEHRNAGLVLENGALPAPHLSATLDTPGPQQAPEPRGRRALTRNTMGQSFLIKDVASDDGSDNVALDGRPRETSQLAAELRAMHARLQSLEASWSEQSTLMKELLRHLHRLGPDSPLGPASSPGVAAVAEQCALRVEDRVREIDDRTRAVDNSLAASEARGGGQELHGSAELELADGRRLGGPVDVANLDTSDGLGNGPQGRSQVLRHVDEGSKAAALRGAPGLGAGESERLGLAPPRDQHRSRAGAHAASPAINGHGAAARHASHGNHAMHLGSEQEPYSHDDGDQALQHEALHLEALHRDLAVSPISFYMKYQRSPGGIKPVAAVRATYDWPHTGGGALDALNGKHQRMPRNDSAERHALNGRR